MSDSEAAIRALAEAVQGGNAHGPWEWQGGYPQRITNGAATLIAEVFDSPDAPPTLVEFIAACDPATMLGLLAELAAARERERLLREAIPVVTDGRFDADTAVEHIRLRAFDPNWEGS